MCCGEVSCFALPVSGLRAVVQLDWLVVLVLSL